jgi:hypothetical protein
VSVAPQAGRRSGVLAQPAEQRTFNPLVQGSIPWRPTRSDLRIIGPGSFFM